MNKPISGRRAARIFLVQSMYAWLVNHSLPEAFEEELLSGHYLDIFDEFDKEKVNTLPQIQQIDQKYYKNCLSNIIKQEEYLNELLAPKLDRKIEQLSPVEHAVLLLGCYELKFRSDVPYKVVINEAIDLAKMFGAQDSHKFINGVLDQLAQELSAPRA